MRRVFAFAACVWFVSAEAAQPSTTAPAPAPAAASGAASALLPAPTQAASPAPSPAPLGRLFFTPAERAHLDIARMRRPDPKPDVAAAEAPPPPPVPQIVSYGGIVRRSDGKAMLWINNRLVEEKEALSTLNLKGKVRPNGSVSVQVPETGATIDVKVGQSVELQTGRVAESRRKDAEKATEKTASAEADTQKGAGTDAPAPKPGSAASPSPPAATTRSETEVPDRQPGSVGLKLDLGSRPLRPAEEQQLRR